MLGGANGGRGTRDEGREIVPVPAAPGHVTEWGREKSRPLVFFTADAPEDGNAGKHLKGVASMPADAIPFLPV